MLLSLAAAQGPSTRQRSDRIGTRMRSWRLLHDLSEAKACRELVGLFTRGPSGRGLVGVVGLAALGLRALVLGVGGVPAAAVLGVQVTQRAAKRQ
jgi:hypothetical protein